MIRRKPMNKAGARTLKRRRMNQKLKAILGPLGITSCELRMQGCLGSWALSMAHSRKSRFLTDDEKWMHACLACHACHDKAEAMSHEKMFEVVSEAIAKRGTEAYQE